jgi:hypothetical protein
VRDLGIGQPINSEECSETSPLTLFDGAVQVG